MTNREIKQEIETAKAHIDKLEKKLLNKGTTELKTCNYKTLLNGTVSYTNNPEFQNKYGSNRKSQELAELASKNMVTRNRLEAWVHERQGNDEGKYYIEYKNSRYNATDIGYFGKKIGTVYMSQETAEWICERLNDGRISLED